ncbi:MAG: hypothetical protein LBG80_05405 [Bacteroidales bacterium]|jgi:hypothetical protein|nr:hypothetical protein [Bacteroidales bacterium]
MNNSLVDNEIFGFVKPSVDVHTLGISTISNLLKSCGYKTHIATDEISEAVTHIQKLNYFGIFRKWIIDNHISRIGFSYRLDPKDAKDYFCKLYYQLRDYKMFIENGGVLRGIFFSGLPDACFLVQCELGKDFLVFPGDESPVESLKMLGIPFHKLPNDIVQKNDYDNMRWRFATKLICSEKYKSLQTPDHLGYSEAGAVTDSYLKRLEYCMLKKTLPVIRAHVGPYNPNREEALKEFIDWEKQLAKKGLLDVLSIGTSQLTQSNFGDNWDGLPNGGGVPVNSELEYLQIKEAARPMLVRTYAGTKNIPGLAALHEHCLNISWHALSFWWFCEIDGRGHNTVLENLKEHLKTVKYIASTGKPLEPNVSHHFAFRGADDITYIVSAFLAAKTAKLSGIKHLILQNMLNTPKYTWGIQDLAKGRTMLKIIKELEDANFKISLQTRAGLDYFSPDLEKAKIQLAAVTALMDDIEPDNENSPQIIHVVSYSEAVRLATPDVINESIQITLSALSEYRKLRRQGEIENMKYNMDLHLRETDMYEEAKEAVLFLEKHIPNLYSAEGLYKVFEKGCFPVPYLLNGKDKYPHAIGYATTIKNGGICVVDETGSKIRTLDRYKKIITNYE